ncbi:hypothetical protein [Kribbella sp. CA-293567]|uniref:hypothetical protein n=1 Tax=Kribbella sp. CA-293567 TaxID=3002436 RepID=UPI0022DE85F4|nr:hypothetical protein [Kribbella sp. CA-293567]WBQ03696.1 hypothetical protein OX958_27445 [Kribbella sp. CA-293567]
MRIRSEVVRRSAAVVAGIALAAAGIGVAGALQANATPDSTRITNAAAGSVAAKPAITIKSDQATAKAWAKVAFTGRTTGIATNSVVQVQRLQSGKWVNFPATTKVTGKATYSVWVQSGRVGVNKFRVVTAKATSAAVSVSITK